MAKWENKTKTKSENKINKKLETARWWENVKLRKWEIKQK